MKTLNISEDLKLPPEAVTQTFGILAKRGVGKTYTASVMVEEMLKAKMHVIVIDPIGVWWGLRASADGKSEGLPIVIAGGEHADVPIDPRSGEALANMVVDSKISIVVDVSLFRKGEQVSFMVDFAETLYRRNREAVHMVLDEADAFAPQRPFGNEARLLGAIEDIVRRGRARGIGVTMITQRPAVLNKNVLTQIEVLVVLRLTSPQDRAAIGEWVKMNADPDQATTLLGSLQSLPVGTAWIYSPGWLDLFQKVKIRKRETLDSSSTPKVGEKAVEAAALADVNLDEIRAKLAATIEKVQAEDPKVLKAKIADLEKQLRSGKTEVEVREKIVEVLPYEKLKQIYTVAKSIETEAAEIVRVVKTISGSKPIFSDELLKDIGVNFTNLGSDNTSKTPSKPNLIPQSPPQKDVQIGHDPASPGGDESVTMIREGKEVRQLSKYANEVLQSLAKHWPMQLTRSQMATIAGKSPKSSSFSSAMAELQAEKLIRNDGGRFELTKLGMDGVGLRYSDPALDWQGVRSLWLSGLPAYEKALLQTLLKYRIGLTRKELAEEAGRSATSSAFSGAIANLLRNNLVSYEQGKIRPKDMFFEVQNA